jgi:hypothetical protein
MVSKGICGFGVLEPQGTEGGGREIRERDGRGIGKRLDRRSVTITFLIGPINCQYESRLGADATSSKYRFVYMEAFPLGSNGSKRAKTPANIISAPET